MDDETIRELFAPLGFVTIRRMFGGKGIYHAGVIVAVVVQGELLLKGDAQTAGELEAAGARRWTPEGKNGQAVRMPYWSVPASALDDPEEMAEWARKAFEAALRASGDAGKPVRPSRRPA